MTRRSRGASEGGCEREIEPGTIGPFRRVSGADWLAFPGIVLFQSISLRVAGDFSSPRVISAFPPFFFPRLAHAQRERPRNRSVPPFDRLSSRETPHAGVQRCVRAFTLHGRASYPRGSGEKRGREEEGERERERESNDNNNAAIRKKRRGGSIGNDKIRKEEKDVVGKKKLRAVV